MKSWIAERLVDFGDWVSGLGISLRELEDHWDFCDANSDCLCDDPTCIEIRSSL